MSSCSSAAPPPPKQYNKQTDLLICYPISTSIRGHATEVPVSNFEQPSVVATSLIQTLSWQERKAKFVCKAENSVFDKALVRIIPLIGLTESKADLSH
ncbi:hypothetical protein ACFFLH_10835 [Balneatrix alpica]|uniref:Uncharacterized protein n=1 Tax=Balneatrix alpica TaxID=75684 RepID=A0ABV5ZC98_9GAMM